MTRATQPSDITAANAGTSRANALADRLEQGAQALAALAGTLTATEWQTRVPGDGRKVGVIVITWPRCIRSRSSWRRRLPPARRSRA
jgi:hypothetical protein